MKLKEKFPGYLQGFVTFAYKSGWRRSELSKLTWKQVDLEKRIARIEVGETKNKEARELWLDDELLEILKTLKKNRKTALPFVFLNEKGDGPVKEFRKTWKRALKDAELGKRFLHDFRRSAVRNMVRSGIPEQVAMKVSGHKTRSVFERYNIVSENDLMLAAQKQGEYLKSQMGTISGTITDVRDDGKT